jgi:hypothetical protein
MYRALYEELEMAFRERLRILEPDFYREGTSALLPSWDRCLFAKLMILQWKKWVTLKLVMISRLIFMTWKTYWNTFCVTTASSNLYQLNYVVSKPNNFIARLSILLAINTVISACLETRLPGKSIGPSHGMYQTVRTAKSASCLYVSTVISERVGIRTGLWFPVRHKGSVNKSLGTSGL